MLIISPPGGNFFPKPVENLFKVNDERWFPGLELAVPSTIFTVPVIGSWVKADPVYVWDGASTFIDKSDGYFFLLKDKTWRVVYPEMEEHWILGDWINPQIQDSKTKEATWWWVELHTPQLVEPVQITLPYAFKQRAQLPPTTMQMVRSVLKAYPGIALELLLEKKKYSGADINDVLRDKVAQIQEATCCQTNLSSSTT